MFASLSPAATASWSTKKDHLRWLAVPLPRPARPEPAACRSAVYDPLSQLLPVRPARLLSSCERYELNRSPSWHREGAYKHLCNAEDEKALAAVKAFNPYDLYSKSDDSVDPKKLKPYYQGLIEKFFPEVIEW